MLQKEKGFTSSLIITQLISMNMLKAGLKDIKVSYSLYINWRISDESGETMVWNTRG